LENAETRPARCGIGGIDGSATGRAAFARRDALVLMDVGVSVPVIDPVPPGLIEQPVRHGLRPRLIRRPG
jgi:hypothetical protein